MDWSQHFEKLMVLEGHEPYGCGVAGCSYIAKGTAGQMFHQQLGNHHGNHSTRHSKLNPQPKVSWFKKLFHIAGSGDG